MTTIVGLQGNGWAVMAADSQITEDNLRIISSETPKIIKFKDILIGIRGDARPGDIIAYNWKPPRVGKDITKWVVGVMVPSMIKTFDKYGYDWKDEKSDFNFLVAVKGQLFDIGADMSISRSDMGMYASGSGKEYALGALLCLGSTDDIATAESRVSAAVDIASTFDINTSHPIQVERSYGKA